MKIQHLLIAALFVVAGCSSNTAGSSTDAGSSTSVSSTKSSPSAVPGGTTDSKGSPAASSGSNPLASGSSQPGSAAATGKPGTSNSASITATKPGTAPASPAAASASANGPYTFAFNPPNGASVTLEMKQTVPTGPDKMGTVTSRVKSTYHTAKGGNINGTMKIVSLDMSALFGSVPSAQKGQLEAQLKKMMKDLSAAKIEVVYDKTGKVVSSKVDGAAATKNMFEGVMQTMGNVAAYPTHPVKVGDTWESQGAGPTASAVTYKLLKVISEGGKQVAVVSTSVDTKSTSATVKGTSEFELATGLPISAEVTTSFKNPQTGKTANMKMTMKRVG